MSDLVTLHLVELGAPFDARGIYGSSKTWLPRQFRQVDPDLASALMELEQAYPECFYYSDMRRTAAGSLRALQTRRGAAAPGGSHHNWGGAVDLETERVRARLRAHGVVEMGTPDWKRALDELMESYDLWCHRVDHQNAWESWHYGVGLGEFVRPREATRRLATERWIRDRYGWWWEDCSVERLQLALTAVSAEPGPIDGMAGPRTRAALGRFCDRWRQAEVWKPGQPLPSARALRLLALVSARVEVSPVVSQIPE